MSVLPFSDFILFYFMYLFFFFNDSEPIPLNRLDVDRFVHDYAEVF